MTTPTETLRHEHCTILRMLGCLEVAMQRIRKGSPVEADDLRDMVRFFRDYADKGHHAKEEEHLFPALEAQGIPRDGGPIAVMLQDHQDGRDAVGAMAEALEPAEPAPEQLLSFASSAAHFISLLRDHIAKEDHVLFRMAEDVLPPEQMAELEAIFAKVRSMGIGEDTHDELEALAGRFGERYDIPEQRNADNVPGCASS